MRTSYVRRMIYDLPRSERGLGTMDTTEAGGSSPERFKRHPSIGSGTSAGRSCARWRSAASLVLALSMAVVIAACGGSSTTSSKPSTSNASTNRVASVPTADLAAHGNLTFCTNLPAPPQEFDNASGVIQGSDVDTGDAIAARLGLKPVWINTSFDTILEALGAGKCDLVMAGMFITPPREKVVNFIPYIDSGQQLLVAPGNPAHISAQYASLCGKSLSTFIGTAELATAQKWSSECQKQGKPKINILDPPDQSTALSLLATGHVAAYFDDAPVTQYYAHKSPSQFQVVNPPLFPIVEGIAVGKDKPALRSAVQKALKSIETSGAYKTLLTKWGLQHSAIPPIG